MREEEGGTLPIAYLVCKATLLIFKTRKLSANCTSGYHLLTILSARWGWSVVGQGQAIVLQLIAQVIFHIQPTNFSGLYVRVKNYLAWIKKHAASGACEKSPKQKKTSKKKRKKRYKKKKRRKKKKSKKKKRKSKWRG